QPGLRPRPDHVRPAPSVNFATGLRLDMRLTAVFAAAPGFAGDPTAKSFRDFPLASTVRSHSGLGPRPTHSLPASSRNLASELILLFDRFAAFARLRAGIELPFGVESFPRPSSAAVKP